MRKKAVAASTIRMMMPAPSEAPEKARSPGRLPARIRVAGDGCCASGAGAGAFSEMLISSQFLYVGDIIRAPPGGDEVVLAPARGHGNRFSAYAAGPGPESVTR